MPPTPNPEISAAHQALLDSMDIANTPRPFRNPNWKPSQRRNKNVKQMVGEASRREQSAIATNANSGATTPARITSGVDTPASVAAPSAGLGAATQSLDRLVLERNLQAAAATGAGTGASTPMTGIVATGPGKINGNGNGLGAGVGFGAPAVTYTNIEAAPSLTPAGKRPYCDITGLPARYTDPKTRLRYHDREVFALVRKLPPGLPERYLEARAAHVVLK